MANPVFYLNTDTMNALLNSEYGNPQEEFDLVAEFTDIPYWAAIHFLKTRITVTVYRRLELHVPNEKICTRLGKVTDHRNGKVDISATEEIWETIGPMYWACLLICDMMRGMDRMAAEEEDGGIQISCRDGVWQRMPVRGKQRPDLMVSTFFGGEVMARPYMEDVFERESMELMSMEDMTEYAENGDSACAKRLGMIFLDGDEDRGIEPDPERAVYWFRKAAEAGDPDAMFNLALHLGKGYGVQRSFTEAADWMEKAAKAGDPDAGEIVAEYRMMAINQEKAEKGDAKAQADFADALIRHAGDLRQAGPESDLNEAAHWYRESLKQ